MSDSETDMDFSALQERLLESGGTDGGPLSRQTVCGVHWFLSGAYRYLGSIGLVGSNPLDAIGHPSPGRGEATAFDEVDFARIETALVEELAMGYARFFPFDLFPWERFLTALWLCCYRPDGLPRWPELLAYVSRGAGKNAFMSGGLKLSGIWSVKADANGFVSEVSHQVGDYVPEGESLATIVQQHSLAFVLNLPFEWRSLVHVGLPVELTMAKFVEEGVYLIPTEEGRCIA